MPCIRLAEHHLFDLTPPTKQGIPEAPSLFRKSKIHYPETTVKLHPNFQLHVLLIQNGGYVLWINFRCFNCKYSVVFYFGFNISIPQSSTWLGCIMIVIFRLYLWFTLWFDHINHIVNRYSAVLSFEIVQLGLKSGLPVKNNIQLLFCFVPNRYCFLR